MAPSTGPRFKSSHRQYLYWTIFSVNSIEKTKNKKWPGNRPFKKYNCNLVHINLLMSRLPTAGGRKKIFDLKVKCFRAAEKPALDVFRKEAVFIAKFLVAGSVTILLH